MVLPPHLVFAVVVGLQMLHVETVVGRTDRAEVQRVTDLETRQNVSS